MSELMDDGIIRMPYEMAMSDELSRKQFYSRANSLLTELTEIRAKLEAMESQAAPAEKPAPEHKGWYCAHCQCGVDPSEVTYNEAHTVCGRIITADEPPVRADKPARITEQDAREIAHSALSFWRNTVNLTLDVWLKDHAPALLNKLNADREQVSDVAPAQRQWNYYRTLLKQNGFDGITDILAKYHKLAEKVPAVAVPDVNYDIKLIHDAARHLECVMDEYPYCDHVQVVKHFADIRRDERKAMLSVAAAPSHSLQSADQLDGKYENVCVKCERIFIGAKFDRECDACPDPCQSNEIKGE